MSLVVKCSDGVVVNVDKDTILKFSVGFQKKIAESESDTLPITLDNVNSRSLVKVVEYCTVHNDATISATDLKNWDNKFVKVEPSVLCELASAAYHLEIKPMVDLTCYAIAQLLKGNTPEEIRRIFNIIYDFGPDDDVPPPTIRDKLRNRWIRKTNGKRNSSVELPNPLVHMLTANAESADYASPPTESPTPPFQPPQLSDTDTRSVDDLLSFINSNEPKTMPQQTSKTSAKSKKAKKKKKKTAETNTTTTNTNSNTTPSNTSTASTTPRARAGKDSPRTSATHTSTPAKAHPNTNPNIDATKQPAKDNDKQQRSRKNKATSKTTTQQSPTTHAVDPASPRAYASEFPPDQVCADTMSDTAKETSDTTSEAMKETASDYSYSSDSSEDPLELPEEPADDEEEEEDDGDVDREVEEFRQRLEAAKHTSTKRIALPSALSIALSVLGPKK